MLPLSDNLALAAPPCTSVSFIAEAVIFPNEPRESPDKESKIVLVFIRAECPANGRTCQGQLASPLRFHRTLRDLLGLMKRLKIGVLGVQGAVSEHGGAGGHRSDSGRRAGRLSRPCLSPRTRRQHCLACVPCRKDPKSPAGPGGRAARHAARLGRAHSPPCAPAGRGHKKIARSKLLIHLKFRLSSLRRGNANLLCIVPILVSVAPKRPQNPGAALNI